jgi:hypothetical protein
MELTVSAPQTERIQSRPLKSAAALLGLGTVNHEIHPT